MPNATYLTVATISAPYHDRFVALVRRLAEEELITGCKERTHKKTNHRSFNVSGTSEGIDLLVEKMGQPGRREYIVQCNRFKKPEVVSFLRQYGEIFTHSHGEPLPGNKMGVSFESEDMVDKMKKDAQDKPSLRIHANRRTPV